MNKKLLVLVPMPEDQVRYIISAANAADSPQGNTWSYEYHPAGLSGEQLTDALQNVQAVLGEPDVDALIAAVQSGSYPEIVQMTWAGTDKYTCSTIPFPHEVALCNAVGAFGHIISQYVLGQILSIMQNLPGYRANQPACQWKDLGPVASLDGATVLVFGSGDIGGHIARRLQGFDAQVVGVCRDTSHARPYFDQLCTLDQAQDWLPKADVAVGAIPNSPQTAGWLDRRRIGMMKPGAILVNVGRGNFVDCLALDQALKAGILRGAALDVTNPEPLPEDHPLWSEPRCLITPHISGGSFGRHLGTELRIRDIAADNLRAHILGEPLRTPVFTQEQQ